MDSISRRTFVHQAALLTAGVRALPDLSNALRSATPAQLQRRELDPALVRRFASSLKGRVISPRDGDYVVSIIDGMANIKKYRLDKANERIVLLSESTKDYAPIFIHRDDDFRISGKVLDVVKKF